MSLALHRCRKGFRVISNAIFRFPNIVIVSRTDLQFYQSLEATELIIVILMMTVLTFVETIVLGSEVNYYMNRV